MFLQIDFLDLEFGDFLIMSSSFEHSLEVIRLLDQLVQSTSSWVGSPLDSPPNSRLFRFYLLGRYGRLDERIFAYPKGYRMIPHG